MSVTNVIADRPSTSFQSSQPDTEKFDWYKQASSAGDCDSL